MGHSTRKVLDGTLVGICLALLVAGCNGSGGTSGGGPAGNNSGGGIIQGDSGVTPTVTTVTNPNPNPTLPTGNIQGIVRDAVTGFPIVGAQVTLAIPGSGDNTVTTGASGQYSFANVPASTWSDGLVAADGIVQFGELTAYTLTLELSGVNAALPAGADRYPGAAFAEAAVGFANFADGNNVGLGLAAPEPPFGGAGGTGGGGTFTEAGSGNTTPVSGLTTSLNFVIGRLTESIRGTVRDALNGSPIAGATVTLLDGTVPAGQIAGGPLFQTPAAPPQIGAGAGAALPSGGIRIALDNTSVTTDSNGTFVFTAVPASHLFNVEVAALGYVPGGTLSAFGGACPAGTIGGGLTIDVPATPACVGPPLIGVVGAAPGAACPNITGAVAVCGAPGGAVGSGAGAGEILLSPAIPGTDGTMPYPVATSPADGADVAVDPADPTTLRPSIEICFSERMQMDNAFTGAVLATVDFKGQPIPALPGGPVPAGNVGPGGGVSPGDAIVSALTVWSDPVDGGFCPVGGGSVLTITPQVDLQPGLTYGVFLGGFGEAPPADLAGNACCRSFSLNALGCNPAVAGAVCPVPVGAVFGEPVPTQNLLLFTTNGGGDVLAGPAATLDGGSADFTDSTATVEWDAVPGARGYEVYMSIAGGDFQLIAKTAPGNDPVRMLPAGVWSFNAALNGAAGVTPPAPAWDGVTRNVVEVFIPDVGDDVRPPSLAAVVPPCPAPPGAPCVDVADGVADLSDGFASVRIAIGAVNSNGIVGSLGSPVTIVDNTGPTTNAAGTAVNPVLLGTVGPDGNPGARSGRGQLLMDLFDPNDIDADLLTRTPPAGPFEMDGVPDTILIGFSEPLEATSAIDPTNYQLLAPDGTQPPRLAAINIVSISLDEPADGDGDGLFEPADDIDGDGMRDRGNNVDGGGKGNDFGNAFVTLRIAPATTGGLVDIRDGDFVHVPITSVRDLSVGDAGMGNRNRAVDPTNVANQLGDITAPRLTGGTFVNSAAGVPDVVTVNFSEPVAVAGVPRLLMSGVLCPLDPGTGANAFSPGQSSAIFTIAPGAPAFCDRTNLMANHSIDYTATMVNFVPGPGLGSVLDTAMIAVPGNALDGNFSVLTSDAAGAFTVGGTLPPPDMTMPRLTGVTVTNNSTGVNDVLLLTFDEALCDGVGCPGFFTPGNITVTVNGTACVVGTPAVSNTPALALGDTTITLVIDVTAAPLCDLNNLVAGDSISLGMPTAGAPAVSDIPGNGLDDAFDHAVRNAGNTAYVIQGQP